MEKQRADLHLASSAFMRVTLSRDRHDPFYFHERGRAGFYGMDCAEFS
jgi:hypothetical protein